MNNKRQYNDLFMEIFSVEEVALNSSFSNDSVEKWDSLRQLTLTTKIEETFDIMLDPEDIIGFSSYAVGIEILKKYDIEL